MTILALQSGDWASVTVAIIIVGMCDRRNGEVFSGPSSFKERAP